MRISIITRIPIYIGILILCLEILLRNMGFCDALLYQSSNQYEYIAQPNQDRKRFGAHIHYNSYSQRNEEPDSTKTIILGLGDSVLFGGTWMDQDSLATTLFSKETGLQMLNISAGSWGPDNCAAYMQEKGTFNAKAIILVCSSHDAYDTMSFIPVVGKFPNYPDKQYKLAIGEVINRYALPRIYNYFSQVKRKLDPDAKVIAQIQNAAVAKKSALFNPGFAQIKLIADSLHIPFGIYLHAETNEIIAGQYNEMGNEIIEWAKKNQVLLVKGTESGETISMYKDAIHYNEKGQRHLANIMETMTKNFKLKIK